MYRFAVLLLLLCLASFGYPANYPNKAVLRVLDQTATLSENDLRALQTMVQQAQSAGEELAVVMISSTDGAPHRAFATGLFNAWGLGNAFSNRGVLIFVAVQDRKAELILGKGIDNDSNTQIAQRIMLEQMVPQFKQGNYAMGAFLGAEAVMRDLFHLNLAPSTGENTLPAEATAEAATPIAPSLAPSTPNADHQQVYTEPTIFDLLKSFLAFIPIALAGLAFVFRRALFNLIGCKCEKCKTPMRRLPEEKDDAYLTPAQNMEEKVRSVYHDVWACPRCSHVRLRSYFPAIARHGPCPQCKSRTFSSRTEQKQAATFSTDGWGMIYADCLACQYHSEHRYTIQKEYDRAKGNAIGSYRASSSSFGSSSSGRSSGGSSRGGGASGSW